MALKIVYWSGTGNTETMANAIAEGAQEAGVEVELITADDADVSALLADDVFALGCPAMGDEELEEDVMEPLVEEVCGDCEGKKIAIFGSYEWNEGEWIELWEQRMSGAGAEVVEALKAYDYPDDDALAACKALGHKLAELL